jgi:1-phosphatidylinositol phosphodiesterase
MEWLAHGISSDGLLAGTSQGQSKTVPAVAAHRGQLWCLWVDFDGKLWYAVTESDGEFGPRNAFPKSGLPVISNLNGHLHAVIALDGGELVHYLYDDEEEQTWDCLGPLSTAAGVLCHSSPCLAAFHNKLFLVYLKDRKLYLVIWTNSTAHPTSASNPSGTWSDPILISKRQTFSGIPALFVIDGVLHLLCATDAQSREILGYRYDYIEMTWTQCDDVSEGRAARGVSATSYGENAYLAFLENGPGDKSHSVYVVAYNNGKWQPHESVSGQSASDPPQIAILNGKWTRAALKVLVRHMLIMLHRSDTLYLQ